MVWNSLSSERQQTRMPPDFLARAMSRLPKNNGEMVVELAFSGFFWAVTSSNA